LESAQDGLVELEKREREVPLEEVKVNVSLKVTRNLEILK
jgi:hypothetical protein